MQVRAAETSRDAARAQRYPTLGLAANYGDIGTSFANSHGTFAVTGSLKFNIFDSGKIRSDVEQADAVVQQRKNEMADLAGQIDFQIRTALLDLKSAADQVTVAQRQSDAGESDADAGARPVHGRRHRQHRSGAGAGIGGERAIRSLISSVYSHNLAKVSLARAVGATETNLKQYLGGKVNGD